MKLKIVPDNMLERAALAFNLAPVPLIHTQVTITMARAIMAAADTGVFEALGRESRTVDEVGRISGTHTQATRHLLDCLVGMGYIAWSNGRYALRTRFRKWLLKDSPSNLVGKLRFQISEWDWTSRLEDYVRTGKPLDIHAAMSPREWADYQEAMRDLSVNAAKEFAGRLKLPAGATTMLDIGGSHGLYSIELCRKHPDLRSTILELPGAVDQASAIAAKEGMAHRVAYRSGNALADDLGTEQYDLVIINNVVHHFTAEQSMALARNVHRALKPGGLFGIGEFIRGDRPGQGGVVAAMGGLYFAFTSASGLWSEAEIGTWQRNAGLRPVRSIGLMSLPGWKMVLARKQHA